LETPSAPDPSLRSRLSPKEHGLVIFRAGELHGGASTEDHNIHIRYHRLASRSNLHLEPRWTTTPHNWRHATRIPLTRAPPAKQQRHYHAKAKLATGNKWRDKSTRARPLPDWPTIHGIQTLFLLRWGLDLSLCIR
jgi:hypothetical protein